MPEDALDHILVTDVPSRLQKRICSLYQFVKRVYPALNQFSANVYPTLYKNVEKRYRVSQKKVDTFEKFIALRVLHIFE